MHKTEIKKELNKYHINSTHEKILRRINENPGITLCELTKGIELSKGSVSICIKKLEEKNLIQKYGTFDDKRVFRLHPTKMGKDLCSRIKLMQILKI
ncbi:MarR family transcriptional regulator [Cetobacterium somerae]|uniref:MarR family transcriptional regulator n=1 Tax=Cetobacterium sp. NK01 TaxID=2993530 RepID=UPI002115FA6F|nr:MarR family transcriptional regulator [Cetobacterium sp. NK01]MCQ8212212.1 MarR family transcriptional regulator [Cetobacterium sp. NK01]